MRIESLANGEVYDKNIFSSSSTVGVIRHDKPSADFVLLTLQVTVSRYWFLNSSATIPT